MKPKTLLLAVLSCLSAYALYAGAADPASEAPQYTAEGKLVRPSNYREWVYLSTGLGMNYGPAADGDHPMFTNVFVTPAAYRAFLSTGKWPDKTMFALEIYHPATGSINKSGYYQGDFVSLEAAVKDEARNPDVWAYYNLGLDRPSAEPFPRAACWRCHNEHGAVENTFVQFYPQLLEVAVRKGTVKPDADFPPTAGLMFNLISEQGWTKAEAQFLEHRRRHPEAAVFREDGLNGLGYRLLNARRNQDAIAVFSLATREFPQSANAFDSLADAYEQSGNREQALTAAQKSLALALAARDMDANLQAQIVRAAQERIARLNKTK
ncbi:MAG TPA: cytochrome P460 family protein [Terriglobales bacterium]|nr:cytochrome P460 family protein [Terriglobales bacterium]